MKLERDSAFADLEKSQTAACHSSITAFKTVHSRLVAIAQEAARFAALCFLFCFVLF
jgi:hypothetical protein